MSQLPMSANLKNNKGDRQSRNERHTFVLVHGGWCGGWIWRYVAPALRERGHVVTTPTLTGLGERRHSENRTATLSTHIEDIVAHIEMEELQGLSGDDHHRYRGGCNQSSHNELPGCLRELYDRRRNRRGSPATAPIMIAWDRSKNGMIRAISFHLNQNIRPSAREG
jgi:hypothetical protein